VALQLHTCKPQSEALLARELALHGLSDVQRESGWVLTEGDTCVRAGAQLCFAILSVDDAREVQAASVNALAEGLCACFWDLYRDERIDAPWPLVVAPSADRALAVRTKSVVSEFRQRLRGKMSRVAKLASEELPASVALCRGFCVLLAAENRAIVGSRFHFWGQRRMRDDPAAPSRSYLKVEEAYSVLGRAPTRDDAVVDLGAAPGGWSYSAAKRGAEVLAVDNGPLRQGALSHPRVRHLRRDAFGYRPPNDRAVDWLFCDLIENPYRVLGDILVPWVEAGLCRTFIVNLKFGKHDPVELLRKVQSGGRDGLDRHCSRLIVRQLYHNREEITCAGEVRQARQ